MNSIQRRVAGLAMLALVGCTESVLSPDRAVQPYLQGSLEATGAVDPCTVDLTVTTQAQVDAIACTHIDGSLWIGPSTDITNLDALAGLVSVRDALVLLGNQALTNVDGLSALTSARDLVFSSNNALTNVDGFSSVAALGTILLITDNAVLASLDGLSALTSVPIIELGSNPSLVRARLPALTSPVQRLWVNSNPVLSDLGLPAVGSILQMEVDQNTALQTLDLSSLADIGLFQLQGNDALTNLDGLGPLASMGFGFIYGNATLKNVDGLSSLTSIGDLVVSSNPALSMCACGLYGVLATGGITGSLQIDNNAPGCNSPSEITAQSCVLCAGETLIDDIHRFRVSGALNAGQARRLTRRVESALDFARSGALVRAINKMNAFVALATKLEGNGRIDAHTTDALHLGAYTVIHALEAQTP